jgi:hypothetical protein
MGPGYVIHNIRDEPRICNTQYCGWAQGIQYTILGVGPQYAIHDITGGAQGMPYMILGVGPGYVIHDIGGGPTICNTQY